jgi:AcrR family transcriptional regulator
MNKDGNQRRSKSERETSTRDDLLAAARRCVRDQGLAGTTSRDIATAAGANLAAITYHFGSKDDLIAEALFDELRRRLEPALELLGEKGDQVTLMLGAVERLMADFEAHRRDAPLYLEALVAATRAGTYATTARALLRKIRRLLADQLEGLRDQGLVPAWVEPDAMAALVVAVANGVALQVSIEPQGPDHRAIAGQFASLLLSARPAD